MVNLPWKKRVGGKHKISTLNKTFAEAKNSNTTVFVPEGKKCNMKEKRKLLVFLHKRTYKHKQVHYTCSV